jgi:hypothetical protein
VADTPAQAAAKLGRLADSLDDVAYRATAKAARYGKGLLLEGARDAFGGDRRPSRWRKGRRTAGARYTLRRTAGTTTGVLYPTSDPTYTFLKGRHAGAYPTRQTGTLKRYPAMAPRHVDALWSRPADLFVRRFGELHAAELARGLAATFGR